MKKIKISASDAITVGDGIFKGWGTSLCWWANRVGASEKLVKDAADLFFDKEKGLGLNIMRYNIGGGDNPEHNHITRTDSMMPGFLKKDSKTGELFWDYEADERQLTVLGECYKASAEDAFVEAFSNSPPYFMTVSGCSSGHLNPLCNNLKRSCTDSFADYLCHVCDYIQREKKIKIGSLAPMNEPYTNYWYKYSPKQEGCHISPGKRQSELLLATKRAMIKYSLNNIQLTAGDETNSKRQLKAMKKLSDEALCAVNRISTHTYEKATEGIKNECKAKNKDLWMTETDWSSVSGENAGEMGPAIWFSEKIIEDIYTLNPSAWVIWQIVASYISKDGYLGRKDMDSMFSLTEGYWGCAVADIDKEEYILTQKYYAFGQFSRHIRPGMRLIPLDRHNLAALDEKEGKLVIVSVNPKEKETELSFDLSEFVSSAPVSALRTSGNMESGEHWAEIPVPEIKDGAFSPALKGNSVTTFIISLS